MQLPKPVKCPYAGSCKGGIGSECHEGYEGSLCATCASDYYLRFNTCLKCPRLAVTITSSIAVLAIFVLVFLMVVLGDSKKTDDDRTVADVIVSCFKIVTGFFSSYCWHFLGINGGSVASSFVFDGGLFKIV